MKRLIFEDVAGNHARYPLIAAPSLERWNYDAFLDYMSRPGKASWDEGFLVAPEDPVRHETFRYLVNHPGATLNDPVRFEVDGRPLDATRPFSLYAEETHIQIKREAHASPLDPETDVDLAARHQQMYETFPERFDRVFQALFDFENDGPTDRDGRRAECFADLRERFTDRYDVPGQLRLLLAIAEIIHRAPFENGSKFMDGVWFRSGYEMWENMARGFGGVCSEKASALKFVCDVIGIPNTPVIGSREKPAPDFEDQMLDYLRDRGQRRIPLRAQHLFLELEVGGRFYLVDPTGGNIPLLFLTREDAEPWFRAGYRARMVYQTEQLHLRRVSNTIGDAVLLISEYHLPDIHFDYVFKQGLGVLIQPDLYIGGFFDWGGERRAIMQTHFASLGRSQRLPYPLFLNDENADDDDRPETLGPVEEVRQRIKGLYPNPDYSGDITLVVQPLQPNFWRRPNISEELRALLG